MHQRIRSDDDDGKSRVISFPNQRFQEQELEWRPSIRHLQARCLWLWCDSPGAANGKAREQQWVQTVVREEWTVEVFEKGLLSEGASEERMMNLLQIALKCINPSPNRRPSMSQVAEMIITLKEEEQSSISFNAGSHIYVGETRPL